MPDDYNPPQRPDWDQTTDYGRHWREYVEPPPKPQKSYPRKSYDDTVIPERSRQDMADI